MTILQAILCGLCYWMGKFSFSPHRITFFLPLGVGFLTGLVLGDPATGAIVGANVNLMFMGMMTAGGSLPSDITFGTVVAVALVVTTGVDLNVALALAVPVALIGSITNTIKMTVNVVFVHLQDKYLDSGKYKGVWIYNHLLPKLLGIVLAVVPAALACYFGTAALDSLINVLSGKVLTVFSVIGGMMPAIGIAITLTFLFSKETWPFLFLGFLIIAYSGLSLLALALIGGLVAVAYVQIKNKDDNSFVNIGESSSAQTKGFLPKKAVVKAAATWAMVAESCNQYERMQGLGFQQVFVAVNKYFFNGDPNREEKIIELYRRENSFFNTNVQFGGYIPGIALRLEEQKACGEDIPDDLIAGVKTALMGPTAGVGDTLFQAVLEPIIISICVDIVLTGNPIGGALGFIIFYNIVMWASSVGLFMFGYNKGADAILDMIEGGALNKVLLGAKILGCFVLGGLISNYVKVNCGITFSNAYTTFSIQSALLDALVPGVLSLCFTLTIFWLMSKKKWTANKVILLIAALGIIGGLTGILI